MWLFVQTWLNLARAKQKIQERSRRKYGLTTIGASCQIQSTQGLYVNLFGRLSLIFSLFLALIWFCNILQFVCILISFMISAYYWSWHKPHNKPIICQRNPLKFETWDSACHLAHVAPAIALQVREGDNFTHTVDLWLWDVVEHDNHSLPWQLNLLAWRSCTTFVDRCSLHGVGWKNTLIF